MNRINSNVPDIQTIEELMFEYAAGVLDDARRFIVDAHMQINEKCKSDIALCEELGGLLLKQNCDPVSMKQSARNRVLEMLDEEPSDQNESVNIPNQENEKTCETTVNMLKSYGLSGELIDHLEASCRKGCNKSNWSKPTKGVEYITLDTQCSNKRQSKIRFVRIEPDTQIPAHKHKDDEITLVLQGMMEDEFGQHYTGDLVMRLKGEMHAPKTSPKEGCVCLTLSTKPVSMLCPIKRTFNYIFYRF